MCVSGRFKIKLTDVDLFLKSEYFFQVGNQYKTQLVICPY